MSSDEVFQVLMNDAIRNPHLKTHLGQLLIGGLQLLDLLPQHLNLSLLKQIHQTPMIDLVLNNLSLSLKN